MREQFRDNIKILKIIFYHKKLSKKKFIINENNSWAKFVGQFLKLVILMFLGILKFLIVACIFLGNFYTHFIY